jgi:hypothetical protein
VRLASRGAAKIRDEAARFVPWRACQHTTTPDDSSEATACDGAKCDERGRHGETRYILLGDGTQRVFGVVAVARGDVHVE